MSRKIIQHGTVQTVAAHFDECDHEAYEYEPSDPDVGIFGEAFWCEDCGATASQIDQDVEIDEDGMPSLCGTGTPVWESPIYLED